MDAQDGKMKENSEGRKKSEVLFDAFGEGKKRKN